MNDKLYDLLLSVYKSPLFYGSLPYRRDQLEQYQHPEKDVLPKTNERPQDLTKFLDREFRSLRKHAPAKLIIPDEYVGKTVPDTPTTISRMRPDSLNMGLGQAKWSVGKDKQSPYISVFDSWDFDEPYSSGVSKGASEYLRKRGTPFNIYDRYRFAGDTIPAWIEKDAITTDIELKPSIQALKMVK